MLETAQKPVDTVAYIGNAQHGGEKGAGAQGWTPLGGCWVPRHALVCHRVVTPKGRAEPAAEPGLRGGTGCTAVPKADPKADLSTSKP